MNSNVEPFPVYKKRLVKYTRVTRLNIAPEPISDELVGLYTAWRIPTENFEPLAPRLEPRDGFRLLDHFSFAGKDIEATKARLECDYFYDYLERHGQEGFDPDEPYEFDMDRFIPGFTSFRANSLHIFRILTLIYKDADRLGLCVRSEATSSDNVPRILIVDWSFTLRITEHLFAEIRSFENQGPNLHLWSDIELSEPGDIDALKAEFIRFLRDLIDTFTHDQNTNFFDEKKVTKHEAAVENLFGQRYSAAERLADIATFDFGKQLEKPILGHSETAPWFPTYFYLSSVSLFNACLEALVSTLYHFLLKKEFRDEPEREEQRKFQKMDFEFKLLCIHLFCDGFEKPALDSNDDLWKAFKQVRGFRHDMVHGNLTDEHKIFVIEEDGFQFYYHPARDFRGSKSKTSTEQDLSRSMTNMGVNTTVRVRKTVDEVVEALLDAMDRPTREWFAGWRNESLVPPPKSR